MADTVNLNGSDQVSNIPAYYYGSVAGFVERLGKDPITAKFISKVTFPGGTTISTTVNLLKDPNNPGKVIASTVMASGITYVYSGVITNAIVDVAIGGALAFLGITSAPVVFAVTVVGVVGAAVATTILGNGLSSFPSSSLGMHTVNK